MTLAFHVCITTFKDRYNVDEGRKELLACMSIERPLLRKLARWARETIAENEVRKRELSSGAFKLSSYSSFSRKQSSS